MKIETKKYNRRFVFGDIHGCKKTLIKLIETIKPQKDDALFFLGDYINKGKDSYGVIEYLMNLKMNDYQLFFVRGNHEQEFLEQIAKDDKISNFYYAKKYKSHNLLDINGEPKKKVIDFLNQTEFYFELEDYFLVHAGFNMKNEDFLDDINSMLYIRKWEADSNKLNGKKTIYGHQPAVFKEILSSVKYKKNKIQLDNGCVYKNWNFNRNLQYGRLCCLELNTNCLYYSINIDE